MGFTRLFVPSSVSRNETLPDSPSHLVFMNCALSSGPFGARSSVSGSRPAPLLQLDVVVNQVFLVEDRVRRLANSQAATYKACRRGAGPRPRESEARAEWPPHGSSRYSASMHMSSPSSMKSATRPAFSRDWLKVRSISAGNTNVLPVVGAQLADHHR